MDIRNCEFCNAYVADFEVHTCRIFRNQHRQSSGTLPRFSSGNLPEDIDLRIEQINYEERRLSMNQTYSSWQRSILPNIHHWTECEETAAAAVTSQYGVANQNPHNPEISDFLFPGMAHGEENQIESAYSLQPSVDNSVIMNQNPQFIEAWNPTRPANAPLPVAEDCVLPGFQQTFGQRNAPMNQLDHHLNTPSQMQCSGIYHVDEMPSHFVSNFNESDNTSINQLPQHHEVPLGIPILTVQNAQFNPMNPIPQTDTTGNIHSNKYPKEFQTIDHLEPHNRSRSEARRYACKYCDKTFSSSGNLTKHIRTHTGEKPFKCTVCNQCFTQRSHLATHMRVHTGEKPFKCTACNKGFTQRSHLTAHMRIHNRKTLHKCTECSESFGFLSRLEEHFSSVHPGKKLYKCAECAKCFASLSVFIRHMLLHNKV